MTKRKIVHIDEARCNGCGQCIPRCAEGALKIVDGKARLVSDTYCDGLGACLATCPQDAITIIERVAEEFDEEAVQAASPSPEGGSSPAPAHREAVHAGCPGVAMMEAFGASVPLPDDAEGARPSALGNWPVQLRLVPVHAPFFEGADLLLAADCVPFALADFHGRLLRGRKLLVGCPKLDDAAGYADKLSEILRQNAVRSLTVAHMEVPCCHGLMALARKALAGSGRRTPLEEVVIGVDGRVKSRATLGDKAEATSHSH